MRYTHLVIPQGPGEEAKYLKPLLYLNVFHRFQLS